MPQTPTSSPQLQTQRLSVATSDVPERIEGADSQGAGGGRPPLRAGQTAGCPRYMRTIRSPRTRLVWRFPTPTKVLCCPSSFRGSTRNRSASISMPRSCGCPPVPRFAVFRWMVPIISMHHRIPLLTNLSPTVISSEWLGSVSIQCNPRGSGVGMRSGHRGELPSNRNMGNSCA